MRGESMMMMLSSTRTASARAARGTTTTGRDARRPRPRGGGGRSGRGTVATTTTTTTMATMGPRRGRRGACGRASRPNASSFGEAYATWDDAYEDAPPRRRRGAGRGERLRDDADAEECEEEEYDASPSTSSSRRGRRGDARRRERGRNGDGFEASADVVKLAYKALTGVSEAFTRALDVVLPRWVPMYVIQLVVACGWGAFALASATRLILGVVVVGAVLCLFVALGNDAGDGGGRERRAAGMYEYATDSSARGRRRRADFDERRREAARARKSERARARESAYGDEEYADVDARGAYDANDAYDAYDARAPSFEFDARAFERGAEAFNETFGNSTESAREAFRAARDVTVEVRQLGDEALQEFKRAFNLNGGDYEFDFDDVAGGGDADADVVAVEFPGSARDEDAGSAGAAIVQIIDVDALSTRDSVDEDDATPRDVDVSFEEWIGTTSASARSTAKPTSTFSRDDAPPPRDASSRREDEREAMDDVDDVDDDEFANAFRGAFRNGASARTRTGASRNWLDEFISGQFRGAFQEDLIDVDFVDDDADVDDGVTGGRPSDSPR